MAWYSNLIPDLCVSSCYQLDFATIKAFNCALLLIDIDNTLVPHDCQLPDAVAREFLTNLKKQGLEVALISNNSVKRVKKFADSVELPFYASAKKPLTGVYKKVMKDYQLTNGQLLCIGDQLLTDVLGAHLAQAKVIWTRPLVGRDIFYTKINRFFEKLIYRFLVKKGHISEEV